MYTIINKIIFILHYSNNDTEIFRIIVIRIWSLLDFQYIYIRIWWSRMILYVLSSMLISE